MKLPEISRAVAEFVANTPASAIPEHVRRVAVNTLIDTYATTRAGVVDEASKVFQRAVPQWAGRGRSRIVGTDLEVDPASSAMANGVTSHCLDYDTISCAVSGFVGSAASTALAAWIETEGAQRGEDVVTAYILGWEASAAIARGVNIWHYAHGWHPTATLSHFSASLAVARLIGMSADQVAMVIGAATAEASGIKTMIGNMLNPFHVGKAARNGLNDVHLVRSGFIASSTALESDQGFLRVFNGDGNYDANAIVDSLGRTWDLAGPGPIFKVYPCCGLILGGLDGALELRTVHGIEPGEIEEIGVLVHEYVPRVMHVDVPDHGYAAKFSIPYTMAAAFYDGRVNLATFDRVEPAIVELGRRVRPEVHPKLYGEETFMEKEFTEVEVKTARGRFGVHVDRMHNRGTGDNFHVEDLQAKLADCLRHGRSHLNAEDEWRRRSGLDSSRLFDLWGGAR
jgi:2-methylcitrate dehydratase PrpD